MLWLIITVIIGSMLGPHVLKMGIGILGSQFRLKQELEWVPYVVGAVFSAMTLVVFAIMFLFKPQLTKFVKAYKAS